MPLSSLPAVLAWHHRRYPRLKAQDIYKLIHQGVFGPGHIISSAARARRMLEEEMAALQARSPELEGRAARPGPLRPMPESELEEIDPRGVLVRVNLRPLIGESEGMRREGGGLNVEWLLEAMVESARRVKGDPRLMKRRLAAAVRWCRINLPERAAELERLASQTEEAGYPALHHSPAYARAYRPAYRVVLNGCLKRRVPGRAG